MGGSGTEEFTVADRYVVMPRPHGVGAMGRVHRARDQRLDRPVAVKFVRFKGAYDAKRVERLLREARLTAALEHPGVPAVYDVGIRDQTPYLVMQFVEGITLAELIAKRKRLPLGWTAAVGAQICSVLAAAHQAHLVHRDLKPGNVMLEPDGWVKVLDFGLVLDTDATERITSSEAGVPGTLAYMAPEQLTKGRSTAASDLYALGCTLYEMLTGAVPFRADTLSSLWTAHDVPPTGLRHLRDDVPEPVEALITALLAKNPAERPKDATVVLRALLPHADGGLPLPDVVSDRAADEPRQGYAAAVVALFARKASPPDQPPVASVPPDPPPTEPNSAPPVVSVPAPRLAVARDFLADLASLAETDRRRVHEVCERLGASAHPELYLEPVPEAVDRRFRTLRLHGALRGVVLAPEGAGTWILLGVLPYDRSVAWAAGHRVTVNAITGSLELRDVTAIDLTLPRLRATAATTPSRLFDSVGDQDLARLGIDDETRAVARVLTRDAELDQARAFLPGRQWDALAGLQAGQTVDEVWAEIAARLDDGSVDPEDLDRAVDPEDLDRAVERTGDRVVLVDGPAELLAMLSSPFDLWRVYLHPSQQGIVDARYAGPARVTGGPGTGKTVVALHRARRLAEHLVMTHGTDGDAPRVLLTTFTSTLAQSLREGLLLLEEDAPGLDRIDVLTVDQVVRGVYAEAHGVPVVLPAAEERRAWAAIISRLGVGLSPAFVADEWRQIVLAQGITRREAYLRARRPGRGVRLHAHQRERLWEAFEAFSAHLTETGRVTWETLCLEATRVLEGSGPHRYRHVVVDEAQDLGPVHWRLLRALVAPGSDDLFLVGDAHQRIYGHQVSLSQVGIETRGRSTRLTVNYRTTAEILAWSLGMLRGELIDDLDGGLDRIAGYRSALHGRPPAVGGHQDRACELAALAEAVQGWLDQGVTAEEIGVAVRSNRLTDVVARFLKEAGIPVRVVGGRDQPGAAVSVVTMHSVKGLEFRCMAVVCLNQHQLPVGVAPIEDDAVAHAQGLLRERCLLFVACTRAREELLVSWYGTPSPLLAAVGDGA